MKIVQRILKTNPCYQCQQYIKPQGLMLHSVGCPQPSGEVWCNVYAYNSGACVHAFIDANDGTVYQTLPWNMRGWHGGGSSNDTHIGVEMCESNYIHYTGGANFTVSNLAAARKHAQTAYNAAVELFAMLCKQYNLNPLTQIVSHSEGYRKGIATNHADPEHYWNGLGLGYTMDTFRKDVKAKMGGQSVAQTNIKTDNKSPKYYVRKSWSDKASQLGAFNNLDFAKKQADTHSGYSVFDSSGKTVYNPTKPSKTVTELAKEVIAGQWGNGSERVRRLRAAGYDPNAVQSEVNRVLR